MGNKSMPLAERTPALEKLFQQDAAAESERGRACRANQRCGCAAGAASRGSSAPGAGLTFTDSAGRSEPVALETKPYRPLDAGGPRRKHLAGDGNARTLAITPARVEVVTDGGWAERPDRAMLVLEDRVGCAVGGAPDGRVGLLECGRGEALRRGTSVGATAGFRASGDAGGCPLGGGPRRPGVFLERAELSVPHFRKIAVRVKILAMAEDERGQIWLGGRIGLSVWDGSELRVDRSRRTGKLSRPW